MICSNRSCPYLQRYGAPAEWPDGTRSCPACGARLEAEREAQSGDKEYARLVTVGEFGEPHEAHLAKGRLEAEGVPACVAGEHLANLHAMFTDTDGLIRLQVAPQDVERALGILGQDHSGTIGDAGAEAAPPPAVMDTCPRCGSASVVVEERAGEGIFGLLLEALRGRRHRCFTCGHRFKQGNPAA